jgi:triphosphoribosyl-dephospho-CoA synthase
MTSAAAVSIESEVPATVNEEAVASAFIDACVLDVMALKPGNVGIHGAGHGMEVVDFMRSARAAAPAIAAAGYSVGERIHHAIEATRAAAGTNTNLGIVLLAAPLAQAYHRGGSPGSSQALRDQLAHVLEELSVADAQFAFDAIRLANPGGLGAAERHDVREPARASLLEAMRAAADRDSIARQYVSAYRDVVAIGLARIEQARARGCSRRDAVTEVFLGFLASLPDSHVVRKFGLDQAQSLQRAAVEYARACDRRVAQRALRDWDVALKARGLNPGTSADLTVAALFWDNLTAPAGRVRTTIPRADGLI